MNILKISPDLTELSEIKSFKDSLEKIADDLDKYIMFVKYNKNSKYINKYKFNLNNCKVYSKEYEQKKEEEKEEEEEDDDKLIL